LVIGREDNRSLLHLVALSATYLPGARRECQLLDNMQFEGSQEMKVSARIALLLLTAAAAPGALAADASVENGQEVFKKCRACHDVGPNAKNKVGPLLNGLFGRKAGTIEGFNYSDANRQAGDAGWVWTEEVMMKYLENPREAMPGNRMAFVGLKDEQDRKDVIAYLKTFSN
jgi:cytochrome c